MIMWIAAWPHSGSALFRMLIKDTLGLQTFSKYREPDLTFLFGSPATDFADDWNIGSYKKHTEDKEGVTMIKTHEAPIDLNPTVFILRDGRNAITGLSRFWAKPIHKIITGEDSAPFMDWSTHYKVWQAEDRPYTIIMRYEDMVSQPDIEAARIAEYLHKPVLKKFDNPIEQCKKEWPVLFKPKQSDYREEFTDYDTELFWLLHEETMIATGYGSREENESNV